MPKGDIMARISKFVVPVFLGFMGLQLPGCGGDAPKPESTVPKAVACSVPELDRFFSLDMGLMFSKGALTPYGYGVFFGESASKGFPEWQNMPMDEKISFLNTHGSTVIRSVWEWARVEAFKDVIKKDYPKITPEQARATAFRILGRETVGTCVRTNPVDICVFLFAEMADINTVIEAGRLADKYRQDPNCRKPSDMAPASM
jgi:hypothetical protein